MLESTRRVHALLDQVVTDGISALTQLIAAYWSRELWVLFYEAEAAWKDKTRVVVFDPLTGHTMTSHSECIAPHNLRSSHYSGLVPMCTHGRNILTGPYVHLPDRPLALLCLQIDDLLMCTARQPALDASDLYMNGQWGAGAALDSSTSLMYQTGGLRNQSAFSCINIDTNVTTELPAVPLRLGGISVTLLVNSTHVALITPMWGLPISPAGGDTGTVLFFNRATRNWHKRRVSGLQEFSNRAKGAYLYGLASKGARLYCLHDRHDRVLTVWRCWIRNRGAQLWKVVSTLEVVPPNAIALDVTSFRQPSSFVAITHGLKGTGKAYQFDLDTETWTTASHAPVIELIEPIRATYVVA
jgi:hypothetical protein